MALSVRTRFEVFKRDGFTCRYCGRTSPEVVLEVDHVVPKCDGGSDDLMNLVTSCWECNRGKSGIPLSQVLTGDDPHDQAVLILEKERQLREYNSVLEQARMRRESELEELVSFWCENARWHSFRKADENSLRAFLLTLPAERIRQAMVKALGKGATSDLRYVYAILHSWRRELDS